MKDTEDTVKHLQEGATEIEILDLPGIIHGIVKHIVRMLTICITVDILGDLCPLPMLLIEGIRLTTVTLRLPRPLEDPRCGPWLAKDGCTVLRNHPHLSLNEEDHQAPDILPRLYVIFTFTIVI